MPGIAWPPERVQLRAQDLVLRENGYRSEHGFLYFVESRRRVRVDFDDALVALTRETIDRVRALPGGDIPPPLVDSPKCPRCSLVGLCLPDEVYHATGTDGEPRRLVPARDDALPLYVQTHGLRLGISGDEIVVSGKDEKHSVRMLDTSQICLLGNVQVTTPAIKTRCERDIPIGWSSQGGWFYGLTRGMATKTCTCASPSTAPPPTPSARSTCPRRSCAPRSATPARCCAATTPTPARRWACSRKTPAASTAPTRSTACSASRARPRATTSPPSTACSCRTRSATPSRWTAAPPPAHRPAQRPALVRLRHAGQGLEPLSLYTVGFEPFVGFLHQPRHGRPALALDLMEEFRPLVADSVVISAVNNRVVRPEHFVKCGPAVNLTKPGRAAFIQAHERRMDELVTHPVFGDRISDRRVLEVQARLPGRYFEGELDTYPAFETRCRRCATSTSWPKTSATPSACAAPAAACAASATPCSSASSDARSPPRERIRLEAALLEIVHRDEDQVMLCRLGPVNAHTERRVATLGRPFADPARTAVVIGPPPALSCALPPTR